MMKKLFFTLTILLFICKPVLGIDCSGVTADPTVKLTSSYGKLVYNRDKNAAEITELAKSLNLVETGLFASGLSTVNITFDITLNALGTPVANEGFCVVPTEINLFLGLENPVIYLAKELQENSCEYNLVLHHEKTHQQINKSTLEYYLPMFKDAARKIARSLPPIPVRNITGIKQAIGELTQAYNSKMTPVVDLIKKEMIAEQKKLDNRQNYLNESRLCP